MSGNSFEKEYYEAQSFWDHGMLEDDHNKARIQSTMAILPRDLHSLVDVGCGNGVFVHSLQRNFPGLNLMAVDRSSAALKFVKTNKREADIIQLPFGNQEYDCVTCLEVIEHLPVNIFPDALSELTRISKRYVVISTPYNEKLEDAYTKCPQCKSLFNRDLHLRTFTDSTMKELLTKYGYKCIAIKKEGLTTKFVGQDLFRKLFYPEQVNAFLSPICPICGYSADSDNGIETKTSAAAPKRKAISYITALPKKLWPKTKSFYWVIALYERIQ